MCSRLGCDAICLGLRRRRFFAFARQFRLSLLQQQADFIKQSGKPDRILLNGDLFAQVTPAVCDALSHKHSSRRSVFPVRCGSSNVRTGVFYRTQSFKTTANAIRHRNPNLARVRSEYLIDTEAY